MERNCFLIFTNKVQEAILSTIKHSGANELQIEGAIFREFNDKRNQQEIKNCLEKINNKELERSKESKKHETLKIQAMGINLINESKYGGDWVLDIKYFIDNNEVDRKMIPIQSKREGENNLFKELKDNELRKKGTAQSNRLSKLTREAYYMFFSKEKKSFLLPVKAIKELKENKPPDKYPLHHDALYNNEYRINFSEFFIASLESRIGETGKEKIKIIEESIRNKDFDALQILLKFSTK